MKRIVVASKNRNKIREISLALDSMGIEVLSLEQFDVPEAPETGDTFIENVYQKSYFYVKLIGLPVLSDDSGLVIDALEGAPGVYSSHFAGVGASDKDNIKRVITLLNNKKLKESGAAFKCFMMLTFPDLKGYWSQGELKGKVITKPRGAGGFGYDPIFIPVGDLRTLAEYTIDEKNRISHRGRALRKLVGILKGEADV